MDMKLYRQHLAKTNKRTQLDESAAQTSAAKLSQKLDEFERASKNLLDAWNDAIDTIDDDNITHEVSYPFAESFDDVVREVSTFVKHFKDKLRQVR